MVPVSYYCHTAEILLPDEYIVVFSLVSSDKSLSVHSESKNVRS